MTHSITQSVGLKEGKVLGSLNMIIFWKIDYFFLYAIIKAKLYSLVDKKWALRQTSWFGEITNQICFLNQLQNASLLQFLYPYLSRLSPSVHLKNIFHFWLKMESYFHMVAIWMVGLEFPQDLWIKLALLNQ